jgi:hypothetical protein
VASPLRETSAARVGRGAAEARLGWAFIRAASGGRKKSRTVTPELCQFFNLLNKHEFIVLMAGIGARHAQK